MPNVLRNEEDWDWGIHSFKTLSASTRCPITKTSYNQSMVPLHNWDTLAFSIRPHSTPTTQSCLPVFHLPVTQPYGPSRNSPFVVSFLYIAFLGSDCSLTLVFFQEGHSPQLEGGWFLLYCHSFLMGSRTRVVIQLLGYCVGHCTSCWRNHSWSPPCMESAKLKVHSHAKPILMTQVDSLCCLPTHSLWNWDSPTCRDQVFPTPGLISRLFDWLVERDAKWRSKHWGLLEIPRGPIDDWRFYFYVSAVYRS